MEDHERRAHEAIDEIQRGLNNLRDALLPARPAPPQVAYGTQSHAERSMQWMRIFTVADLRADIGQSKERCRLYVNQARAAGRVAADGKQATGGNPAIVYRWIG